MQLDFRQLVEKSNNIIVTVDSDGILRYINPAGLSLFGYSESQVVGKHVVGTLSSETSPTGEDKVEEINDIMAHPERYALNLDDNMTSDGETIWMLWSNTPIREDSGKLIEINAIGVDVTEIVTELGDGNPERGAQLIKRAVGAVK